MTAASAFLGRSAAYLLTDAGSFDDAGRVFGIGSKVIASERLRIAAVLAGRRCDQVSESGSWYSPAHEVRQLFENAETQAALLAELPSLMRKHAPIVAEIGGYFQFTIALWHAERQQPEAYVIGSPGHTFKGLPPFQLGGVNPVVMPPVDRSLWPVGDLTRAEACAIVDAQRRARTDGAIHVGGFAELTSVDASGIRTEVVRRWRDRVGRKIRRPLLFRWCCTPLRAAAS